MPSSTTLPTSPLSSSPPVSIFSSTGVNIGDDFGSSIFSNNTNNTNNNNTNNNNKLITHDNHSKSVLDNVYLDIGINTYQNQTPYDPGFYFQLEAVNIPPTKTSKGKKSPSEANFHILAQGGHFDHLIQRYRSPSSTIGVSSIAFGTRISLTRIQELFVDAISKKLTSSPSSRQLKIPPNLFKYSSLPNVLVVGSDVIGITELSAITDVKKLKENKLYELVPNQPSRINI